MSNDSQELVDEISTSTEMSNDDQELVEEMYELVVEIEGRLENRDISHATRPPMDSNIENYPSIFGKWQCWDDFGASFLPETQKWQFVACMTQYFGLNVKSFVKYMQGKVDLAWSYYRGVDEQFRAKNSKSFIEHLLASSCFLIFAMVYLQDPKEYYQKVIEDKIDDQNSSPKGQTHKDYGNLLTILKDDPAKNQTYMLTMKYQIPWFVLEAVYTKLSNIGKVLNIPIVKFALPCFPKNPRVHTSKVDGGTAPEGGFKHLLHIFHWSRTPNGKYLQCYPASNWKTHKMIGRFHIPSATELQLSQTVFVKDEGNSIDVSYFDNRRLSGVMQLTPSYFLNYSIKLYESLLRFEQWYGVRCGIPFSSYVTCMASLLKTEADVRVLRANDIIPNTSFDNKDVLRCLQELGTLIDDELLLSNELIILQEKVMEHHKRSAYIVYGEFKKRYCSNPWIIISVIAGILLFVLTFIQTLYGTLSYYKQ